MQETIIIIMTAKNECKILSPDYIILQSSIHFFIGWVTELHEYDQN